MPEQNFLAPGPKQSEFNTLNSTVASLSEQMENKINGIFFQMSSTANTKTINIPNSTSGLLFCAGPDRDRAGLYAFTTKGTGEVVLDAMFATAVHTLNTTVNNKITITTSNVVRYMVIPLYGTGITIS